MSEARAVAMVSVFNEEDIIVEVIENLLDNGLEVVALDNGSTDDSFELCSELAARRRFVLERWQPEGISLEELTLRLYRMASRLRPDWLFFSDGDEIHQTAHQGRTIREAISEAEAAGHNVLQCNRFDFFMSDHDDPEVTSPVRRLRHYSWQGDCNYRAFRNIPGVRAVPSFAHYPLFPGGCPYRIAPEKLVLRHYPYRSRGHAERKISNLVGKIRTDPSGRKAWHDRYLRIAAEGQHLEPVDHRMLARYDEDDVWDTRRLHTPFTDFQPTQDQLFTPDGLLRRALTPTIDWERGTADGAGPR